MVGFTLRANKLGIWQISADWPKHKPMLYKITCRAGPKSATNFADPSTESCHPKYT